ncbi:MAG: amidohydrolase family protein [Planctomycetota bacterium]
MRIDAHQHIWSLARGDYGWLTPDLGVLYRDFNLEDLAPLLERHDIHHTVLVQAAPTVAETEFCLAAATRDSRIAGVVGWIDFGASDARPTLERLATHPKLKGIRPMIQDIEQDDWMLSESFAPVFEAMVRLDLCFDALVLPRHLPNLATLCARHPELKVVVDHGAKPRIRDHGTPQENFSSWRRDLTVIARSTKAYCKLSGLVTEANADWGVDDLRPYFDVILAEFGPQRLLWGSDWPVVCLAGDYDRWWDATAELLKSLSTEDRDAILGQNALRFYGLDLTA